MRSGQPALNPLQRARERDAVILHVVERRPIARVLGAAGERQVVVVRDRRARDRPFPVRIRGAEGIRLDPTEAAGRIRVAGRARRTSSTGGRIRSPRDELRVHVGPVLVAIEHIETPCRRGRRGVGIVLDARPAAARALFRFDQDDAVGGAAAVNGGRRGVFENGDRSDVGGIQQVERIARQRRRPDHPAHPLGFGRDVIDRHAVDHVERIVAVADRAAAADQNLRSRAGLAVVQRDIDARRATREHLRDVGRHADVGLRRIDGRDRSGDGLAPLRPVPRHDDRFEERGLRGKRELRFGGSAGGHRDGLPLRRVPDSSRTHQHSSRRNGRERVAAVVTTGSLQLRAFDLDDDTGERLPCGAVDDLSSDRAGVLRGERECREGQQRENGNCVSDESHRVDLKKTVMPSEMPPP